jgi:DNA-binding transcriptional MerR regulator
MQPKQYRTSGEVAAEVGITRWQLCYFLERGVLPEPALRVPGRRLFTEEDVRRIRAALAERAAAGK